MYSPTLWYCMFYDTVYSCSMILCIHVVFQPFFSTIFKFNYHKTLIYIIFTKYWHRQLIKLSQLDPPSIPPFPTTQIWLPSYDLYFAYDICNSVEFRWKVSVSFYKLSSIIKECVHFFNKLYDITWCWTVYA